MMIALQTQITDKMNDGEIMLTTQDIAIINENMPHKFDVVITENKGDYTIEFTVNNRKQQLVTWAGRVKVFKNFETVLTCLQKYVFNARNYSVYSEGLSSPINLLVNNNHAKQTKG